MRKFLVWSVVLVLIASVGWVVWKWYSASEISGEALSVIPRDAIYCLTTNDPIASWKEISSSPLWAHLQKNTYFASLTSSANRLDSLIRDNDLLFDLIGSRALVVSAHMTGYKTYDFLFLVDLKEVSGIKFLNEYLTHFSTEGFIVKTEKIGPDNLLSLYDPHGKSTLYVSMPGSFLVASYSRKIIISALDTRQKNNAATRPDSVVVPSVAASSELAKLYLNYAMLPRFMGCYSNGTNEYVNRLSKALKTTMLDVRLEENSLSASGHTVINDSVESYLKTLAVSGKGATEFLEISPQRTAFCVGLGFSSFSLFFDNFQKNLQQDVSDYAVYQESLKEVENYLKIDLRKNFISWIGEEVALVELQSSGQGLDNETALILKAGNIENAKQELDYIEKMIRKRTPVKFKQVEYRGHIIRYLSMKGLFKILLGKFFARYDKPYYTIINNFVVFSNHPQTLESMIDDYLDKNTLIKSAEFREFRKGFDDEGSAFIFLNTPVLFNSIKKLADPSTRVSMEANKEYITCFRQIGFQLVPEGDGFKTTLKEQFTPPVEFPVVAESDPAKEEDTLVIEPVAVASADVAPGEPDPMALPYIYIQNVNADTYTGYFADSTVQFEVALESGFKDGSYTEYHSNGEVKMKGHFKHDKRNGIWRLFDDSGKVILKRNYEEGEVKREKSKE
jgi:hypothetical protein